jgi:hypothetical protein
MYRAAKAVIMVDLIPPARCAPEMFPPKRFCGSLFELHVGDCFSCGAEGSARIPGGKDGGVM